MNDFETYAVHAAQMGNNQAWGQLFERHIDEVYRFCVAPASGQKIVAISMGSWYYEISTVQVRMYEAYMGNPGSV